jgi:hypothetical protein
MFLPPDVLALAVSAKTLFTHFIRGRLAIVSLYIGPREDDSGPEEAESDQTISLLIFGSIEVSLGTVPKGY